MRLGAPAWRDRYAVDAPENAGLPGGPFLVGATHCVALVQQSHMPEEGEAVPRPYRLQISTRRPQPSRLTRDNTHRESLWAHCSGCRPLCRTPRRLRRWNEQVGRHAKPRTQRLHHRHAQSLLAGQDLAHAARRSEDRDHVCAREPVLIHEVPDQLRSAGRPPRPLGFLHRQQSAALAPAAWRYLRDRPSPIVDQRGRERGRAPARCRSRRESHPSNGLRVNPVELCVAAEEADREDSRAVLDRRCQSVVVALDIEDHATGLENTRFRVRRLHILRIAPVGVGRNVEPSLVLRSRSLDALMRDRVILPRAAGESLPRT